MATFSCPYCTKVIEYIPSPSSRIIWVEKYSWSPTAKARELERKLDIPRVEHIYIFCPHCGGEMSVFFSLNPKPEKENSTLTAFSEDFSIEL